MLLLDKTSILVLDGLFLTSIAYNFASFNSIYNGGVAFTGTDPLLGSVFVVFVWIIVRQTQHYPKLHGAVCVIASYTLGTGGALSHILKRNLYQSAPAYHNSYWLWAVCLNTSSMLVLIARTAHKKRKGGVVIVFTLMAFAVSYKLLMSTKKNTLCSDVPYFSIPPPESLPHLPVQRTSQYLAMSDGVELAVDVYLPRGYDPTSPDHVSLPTFLHLTRYHRAEQRSLLTKFMYLFGDPPTPDAHFAMRSLHYINAFVPNGYAFVTVDVRGTGASFGERPVDLSPREVQDFAELATWVKRQPFCNGCRVGTGGISYDGIAGALMAAQGNIDAAALLFSPGDIFEDIGFVGGIPTTGFVDLYGKFTTASENNLPVDDVDNELPSAFKLVSKYALGGVAPVIGAEHKLEIAVREHVNNFDMLAAARNPAITCKDDTLLSIDGKNYSISSLGIGPDTFEGLKRHGVAVYSVAGYYDSASVRSSARLHNYLTREGKPGQSKLTIGPWTHGARACWTPTARSTTPQFPLFYDVLRFFNCQLKDECDSFAGEAQLNYFISGEDTWKSSNGVWPPHDDSAHMQSLPLSTFFVDSDHDSLQNSIKFKVNNNATSGVVSRWNLVFHLMKKSVTYPDLAQQANTSLTFSAQPLLEKMKLVGSATLSLSIAINKGAKDAAVFAYLEEFDPKTKRINYITEGVIRVGHSVDRVDYSHIGAFDSVKRSFTSKDLLEVKSGEHIMVDIMLEPMPYTIPMGHSLRLRLAGADADNFYLDNIRGLATVWDIDPSKSTLHIPLVA